MKLGKKTRWYDDACGTALGLELLGERWAMLIVRELMFGPRRFSELRRDLNGISANVLTQRLTGLEAAGVVRRSMLPPPANTRVYELTDWGYQAEPAIQELGRWAARSPQHDPTLPLSAVSLMMSYRTMFRAERASGLALSLGIRLGADRFAAKVADGALAIARGESDAADAVITGTPEVLAGITYGGLPLAAAEGDGLVAVKGDRAAAERYFALFALPSKVGGHRCGQ